MPCMVPLNNKNLDISFFAFRPHGVAPEELIGALKYLSYHAESLGCVYSAVLNSIHGNMVVWYGGWIKRSKEDRHTLNATLVSALGSLSKIAILFHHGFFDVHIGESKQGTSAAWFSSGDTILMSAMLPSSDEAVSTLEYTCLALLRSSFNNVTGVASSICLRCQDQPAVVVVFQVWESLQACYSWLLQSDYRKTILPYFSDFADEAHFDVFKAVYVSNEEALEMGYVSPLTIASPDTKH